MVARLTQNQVDARVLHIRTGGTQNNPYTAMWFFLGSVLYLIPRMLRAAVPRKGVEPKTARCERERERDRERELKRER